MILVFKQFVPSERGDQILILISSIAILIVAYFLFISKSDFGNFEDAVELGSIHTSGTVKRRHARSLHWSEVNGDGKLFRRDIIYTPKNTTAEIRLSDNKVLRLEPDSMVQFDEVTLGRIEIMLIEGKVKSDPSSKTDIIVKKKEPTVRIIPYPKTGALLPSISNIAEFERQQTDLLARTRSLLERPSQVSQTKKVVLPNLNLRLITDYELKLLSPLPDKYNVRANKWMKLSWSKLPIPDLVYQLEVSRDSRFQRLISHRTKNSELSIQFEDPGVYFWRVRALRGEEYLISNSSYFTMLLRGGIDSFEGRKVSSQPTGYVTEISYNQEYSHILKSVVESKPQCNQNGLSAGTYYCRIRNITNNEVLKTYSFKVGGVAAPLQR